MLKEIKILFYFFSPFIWCVWEWTWKHFFRMACECFLWVACTGKRATVCQRCLAHFCFSRSQLEHPHGTDGQSAEILLAIMYFYVMRLRYLTEAGTEQGAAGETSFVHRYLITFQSLHVFTDIYETAEISVPGKARIASSRVFAYLLYLPTPRFTTLLDASI